MRCKECGFTGKQIKIRSSTYCAACKKKIIKVSVTKALMLASIIVICMAGLSFYGYKYAVEYVAEQKNKPKLSPKGCFDKEMAWVMARKYVKKHLISPSSAKFNSSPVRSEKLGDCSYFFGGDFESSNAFGVMLAQGFTVKITYNPESDSYTGTDLFIWP